MAKFLNYVEERNASAFKQMFEEAVASKLMDALEEAKVRTAVRMSKEMSKHVHFNPYVEFWYLQGRSIRVNVAQDRAGGGGGGGGGYGLRSNTHTEA